MLSEQETDALLDRVGQGDSAAVTRLLEQHRPRLRRMVGLHFDPQMAQRVDPSDVVQDAMIVAHAKIAEYAETREIAFYAWLRRIAWNRLLDLRRRHVEAQRRSTRRERSLHHQVTDPSAAQLVEILAASATGPVEKLVRRELRQRVTRALEQLSDPQREVLVLRFVEQLTTTETAHTMGLSESAVKGRQLRALEKLRRCLDENLGEE